jgi:NAD(P)-dependent dehydrogenase (short-subunit alcohol dehydrogenase family)
MQDLVGKTAFVTGGASGIGLALGQAFAEADMHVVLADIEAEALAGAVQALHRTGPGVRGVICDVADPASVDDAAKAADEAFGTVHIVCNNAGVGGGTGRIGLGKVRFSPAAEGAWHTPPVEGRVEKADKA